MSADPGPGALDGLRVVEFGGSAVAAAGAHCGRILAELGADVILLEPPGGDPARGRPPLLPAGAERERSIPFLHEHAGKRGITARAGTPEGNELLGALLSGADVVVDASGREALGALGVTSSALASDGALWAAITPYGLRGPDAELPGTDLTLAAAGGFLLAMGWSGDPPFRWGGELALVAAGQQAAVGVLSALLAPDAGERARVVDVSVAECVAAACAQMAVGAEFDGSDQGRRPARGESSPPADGIYPCADGHVVAGWGQVPGRHWPEFIEWMAQDGIATEWVGDARWNDPDYRMARRHEAEQAVRAFFARHTMDELCDGSIPRGFMLYPLQTTADLARDPQLHARGWFRPPADPGRGLGIDYPGPPYRLSETPAGARHDAPLVGEHNDEIYRGELGVPRERLDDLAARGVI